MCFTGIAVLVAGCATEPGAAGSSSTTGPAEALPSSIAEYDIRGGLPTEAIPGDKSPSSPDSAYPFPTAGWLDGGGRFAVVLVGSSSCPAVTSSIEVPDPHTVRLGLDRQKSDVCSADLAPRTYVIGTPTDVDRAQDVTLEYGDSVVTLPAL